MIERAVSFVRFSDVAGDYLEFGVFKGASLVNAWEVASRYGQNEMRFHVFDSFSGLPDPSLSDVDQDGEFAKGEFSYDRADFERNLRRAAVDFSRLTITEGFYDVTLQRPPSELGIKTAAIVWIDCDLYSSTVSVLDFVTNLLVDGSVLIFDDWHCFHSRPDRGEQRACAEWLERNPDIRLRPYRDFHWAGSSFIVNRLES